MARRSIVAAALMAVLAGCAAEIGDAEAALDECPRGFRMTRTGCDVIPPRPIAPLSGSRIGTEEVELRWELAPGVTRAIVDVCADRDCRVSLQRIEATTSPIRVRLPEGNHYWHLTGGAGGSSGLAPSATWVIDMSHPFLPFSPANGADVNGDAYEDVAIASHKANRVHVHYGAAAGIAATANVDLLPPTGAGEFGYTVADAGDVNGDGFRELIVGAGNTGVPPATPHAYVFYGGPSGVPATPGTTLTGPLGSAFGVAIVPAGDVNHDGYGDVVIGSPAYGAQKAGRAELFLGGAGGLSTTPAQTFTGTGAVAGNFGSAIALADVNGDNAIDLVVGEAEESFATTPTTVLPPGRVLVFHATATGFAAAASATIQSPDGPGLGFGHALASAGDWNWDGFEDVVVSAYGYAGNDGRVYVLAGGPTGLGATPIEVLDPPAAGAHGYFGYELDGGDDLDLDHHADLAIGETDALAMRGRAMVVYGRAPWDPPRPHVLIESPWPSLGFFGQGISMAGDLNGDWSDDLVIGAPSLNSSAGGVGVYPGAFHANVSTSPSLTISGPDGTLASYGLNITH